MIFYKTVKFLLVVFFSTFFRIEFVGLDNVPATGSAILCANHLGSLDPFSVGCRIKRKIFYMAKEELFKIKFISYLLDKLCAFPVKRGKADMESIKNSIRILKRGDMLGIYPEGTRSKSGDMLKPKPGIALFAIKTGAPIVPVAISGSYRPFSRLRIKYGQPFKLDCEDRKYSNEELVNISSTIMERVKKLLEE